MTSFDEVPEWIWGSRGASRSSRLPAKDWAAPSRKNSPAKALTWPFALVLRRPLPRPLRTYANPRAAKFSRSEEHTSELQSLTNLVCRLLLEKKKKTKKSIDEAAS